MEVRRDILWRVYLSFLGIVVVSLLVIGRSFYIQQFRGNYWRSMSDSLHQRIEEIDAGRGTIYSEDGQMLSTSLPTFDIYMDFLADGLREKNGKRFRENIDSFCVAMSGFFKDKSAASYKKALTTAYNKKARYYPVRKKLSFEEYKVFREFPLARFGKNKGGVIVEVNNKRLMPYRLLANRTIGLSREYIASSGKIKKQNVGLEKSYDSLLSGQKGQRLVRFIAGGVPVPLEGYQVEPENGKDIITTLDVNIQDIVETALMKQMRESEARYGTAIVMEVKTGKLKAIANLGRQRDGSYWEDNNYALNVTEPGSTMKLATLLSVLDEGKTRLDDLVQVGTSGQMIVGPRTVNDAERSPKSILTVKECFAHSSNVGMSKLAYQNFGAHPKKFKEYLNRFHLDVRSPIDLTDIPKPQIASFERNAGGTMNMVTMSFGYALQISPLHTLTLYNGVANDGKMMKPYLVNRIEKDGLIYREFHPEILTDNFSGAASVKAARECMEAVISEGTGRLAFKDMSFKVAGKTGTAHVADGPIRYADMVYQASFVGYFPADNPQYSCIVVLRTKPHAYPHYGGQLAAPVFREIATKLYSLYVSDLKPKFLTNTADSSVFAYKGSAADIKNVYDAFSLQYRDSSGSSGWAALRSADHKTALKALSIKPGVMPDLTGFGLKDALYILEQNGLETVIEGRGKVVRQSVEPGVSVSKGMKIYIGLN